MDNRDLLTAALGLGPDWEVGSVDFDGKQQEMHLHIRYRRSDVLPVCRECGKAGVHVHDYRPQKWRHMDFWQHKTYLHAEVPRVRCEAGHVLTMEVPWARPGSGYTLLLEGLVLEMGKGMPVAQMSRIVRLADKKLWRILDWYTRQAVESQDLSRLRRVGMDETSRRRRHQYITVFINLDTHRVVFITKGKGQATVAEFAAFLRRKGVDPKRILDVTCDMSEAFLSGVDKHLPNAKVTLDRFHIVKLVSDAVSAVRRREQRDQPCLVGSHYALLKGPSRLSDDEKGLLRDITRRNIETARAYQLRLAFDDFFKQNGPVASRGFLKGWITAALSSGIPEMETAATSIRRHWKMVVNWTKTRLSNGILEGFNSLLQAMKSCARGYRTFEFIRTIGYLIGIKPIVNSHSK
jgi:transposase